MRIVILGGYGLFGSRIVRSLASDTGFDLVVAGRRIAQAAQLIDTIVSPQATLAPAHLDTGSTDFPRALAALRPDLVIDTAGPFQGRDFGVAEAALRAGAHCIDLADGRAYLRDIRSLEDLARRAGRRLISGASSVPGLHAAVLRACQSRFSRLEQVHTMICPGNRTPRGWATTQAILGYVGKPFPMLRDGRWQHAHGWQSQRRYRIDGLGTRWAGHCEVPDLDLLPERFPSLRTVEFRAGLELQRMHLGLWLASWAVRLRLIDSMTRFARPLFALSERWQSIGSDAGCMQVELRGQDPVGAPLTLRWTLLAQDGDGPQIPATPAIVLARKLARGELQGAGASPCLDLFTLEECMDAMRGFAITAQLDAA